MKVFLTSTILLGVLLISFNSCNDKIDLIGEFKETAVVYGLLDQSDSVHLIKITRAFVGPGNALEISQIPDSNYFQEISVFISEELPNGSTGRIWTLFDTLVNTKETDGIFYAPEQKVYAFYTRSMDNSDSPSYQPLNAQATYNLRIIINQGQKSEFEVFGSTRIVSGISTTTDAPHYQFKFAENANLTGEYRGSIMHVLNGNASIINTTLSIHLTNYVGSDASSKSIQWKWGEEPIENGNYTIFNGKGETFFRLIDQACQSGNPAITRRNVEGITVSVVGGSEDLLTYILVNKPNTSITQNKPTFTNLTATNDHPVIGLFSSRYTHRVYHPMVDASNDGFRCLDRISMHELCIGPITGIHSFCSQQPLDIAQGQTWACN